MDIPPGYQLRLGPRRGYIEVFWRPGKRWLWVDYGRSLPEAKRAAMKHYEERNRENC